jgi:acyl-CoA hydrolase
LSIIEERQRNRNFIKGGRKVQGKTVDYSSIVMSSLMQPSQANPSGNVHGGEIMKMMDNAAGVVALRHSRTNSVTAKVDEIDFLFPIRIGNMVTCSAFLTYVGKSSMEVCVSVHVEDLTVEAPAVCALTGYFTMVALDAAGRPTPVPPLLLATEVERMRFEEGRHRHEAKLQKRGQCIIIPG